MPKVDRRITKSQEAIKKALIELMSEKSFDNIITQDISDKANVNRGTIIMELATNTLHKLKNNQNFKQAKDALIHSDQGTYYTHPDFQKHVKKLGICQSMSRRWNCWDNAPIESFFGQLKDEANIKSCKTLNELRREIDEYITYYNHHRYQWNLKKMTPVQYRDHLLQAA